MVEARSTGGLTSRPRHSLRRPPSTKVVARRFFLSVMLARDHAPERGLTVSQALTFRTPKRPMSPRRPSTPQGKPRCVVVAVPSAAAAFWAGGAVSGWAGVIAAGGIGCAAAVLASAEFMATLL